ncbi:MAG: hypothetical protein ACRC5M_04760 [Anaeroplasmataceae bacterium]
MVREEKNMSDKEIVALLKAFNSNEIKDEDFNCETVRKMITTLIYKCTGLGKNEEIEKEIKKLEKANEVLYKDIFRVSDSNGRKTRILEEIVPIIDNARKFLRRYKAKATRASKKIADEFKDKNVEDLYGYVESTVGPAKGMLEKAKANKDNDAAKIIEYLYRMYGKDKKSKGIGPFNPTPSREDAETIVDIHTECTLRDEFKDKNVEDLYGYVESTIGPPKGMLEKAKANKCDKSRKDCIGYVECPELGWSTPSHGSNLEFLDKIIARNRKSEEDNAKDKKPSKDRTGHVEYPELDCTIHSYDYDTDAYFMKTMDRIIKSKDKKSDKEKKSENLSGFDLYMRQQSRSLLEYEYCKKCCNGEIVIKDDEDGIDCITGCNCYNEKPGSLMHTKTFGGHDLFDDLAGLRNDVILLKCSIKECQTIDGYEKLIRLSWASDIIVNIDWLRDKLVERIPLTFSLKEHSDLLECARNDVRKLYRKYLSELQNAIKNGIVDRQQNKCDSATTATSMKDDNNSQEESLEINKDKYYKSDKMKQDEAAEYCRKCCKTEYDDMGEKYMMAHVGVTGCGCYGSKAGDLEYVKTYEGVKEFNISKDIIKDSADKIEMIKTSDDQDDILIYQFNKLIEDIGKVIEEKRIAVRRSYSIKDARSVLEELHNANEMFAKRWKALYRLADSDSGSIKIKMEFPKDSKKKSKGLFGIFKRG